jgi:predicted CoA-binding protein
VGAIEAAESFLKLKRFAFVGVSRDPKDFSRMLFRELVQRGYDVVPVNPAAQEIEGRPAFARVGDVVPPVEGAYLLLPPAQAERAAKEALDAGVRQLWFHRGGGPGSGSPAAAAQCAAAGVTPVTDLCPFMMLAGASWFHRLHGHFRRRNVARR